MVGQVLDDHVVKVMEVVVLVQVLLVLEVKEQLVLAQELVLGLVQEKSFVLVAEFSRDC